MLWRGAVPVGICKQVRISRDFSFPGGKPVSQALLLHLWSHLVAQNESRLLGEQSVSWEGRGRRPVSRLSLGAAAPSPIVAPLRCSIKSNSLLFILVRRECEGTAQTRGRIKAIITLMRCLRHSEENDTCTNVGQPIVRAPAPFQRGIFNAPLICKATYRTVLVNNCTISTENHCVYRNRLILCRVFNLQ